MSALRTICWLVTSHMFVRFFAFLRPSFVYCVYNLILNEVPHPISQDLTRGFCFVCTQKLQEMSESFFSQFHWNFSVFLSRCSLLQQSQNLSVLWPQTDLEWLTRSRSETRSSNCFLLFVFSVRHKNTRHPFSGTAERIFMKLLPNDSGENGVCIAIPKSGLGPRLIFGG